jgi:uncharacterized RDD family membrane protein YckC
MVQYSGTWVCATCKPTFFQRVRQGDAPTATLAYAGFGSRLAAKILDGILLYVAQLPFMFVLGVGLGAAQPTTPEEIQAQLGSSLLLGGLGIVIGVAYSTFFIGRFGATPGKMALKLKVVAPNGDSISYGRAAGRYFGEFLSALVCGIGYLMVLFDKEKKALHDSVASTRVVRTA